MKIYTKTGDKGETSLVGGKRISKAHPRLEAYGTIDELNAFIGLLIEFLNEEHDRNTLNEIQSKLFSIGCLLATDPNNCPKTNVDYPNAEDISLLEKEIDRMEENLPSLNTFVLPGECKSSAMAHVCRTITRRAERAMYRIESPEQLDENCFAYINRLSDYFFVLSRKECKLHQKQEKKWTNTCK